jgi:hypothetical protein
MPYSPAFLHLKTFYKGEDGYTLQVFTAFSEIHPDDGVG